MPLQRYLAAATIAGAFLGGGAATAAAAPSAEACGGQVVALVNHAFGDSGASGNPQASAGAGFFLGSSASDGIRTLRDLLC